MTITRKTTCFGAYWPSSGFLQEMAGGQKASGKAKPQMVGWSDEGCREAGSQKLEDQS